MLSWAGACQQVFWLRAATQTCRGGGGLEEDAECLGLNKGMRSLYYLKHPKLLGVCREIQEDRINSHSKIRNTLNIWMEDQIQSESL